MMHAAVLLACLALASAGYLPHHHAHHHGHHLGRHHSLADTAHKSSKSDEASHGSEYASSASGSNAYGDASASSYGDASASSSATADLKSNKDHYALDTSHTRHWQNPFQ